MTGFQYSPSHWVPFRDTEVLDRCRRIPRSRIDQHPNPDFRIRVIPDTELEPMWIADIYDRIRRAAEEGRRCVMLLPNPWPGYRRLACRINKTGLDCKHVWLFALDEYANEHGQAAPEDWPNGFMCAMLRFLWSQIDESLRPPRSQVHAPNDRNADRYFEMMEKVGGVDISYTGPGWTGHVGFVEPDAPEFDAPLEQWKRMGTRVCTLNPFTLAQNSLHGCFGYSGDIAAVPPKAVTVGPREIISAKHRWEFAGIGVHGTATSWQRMIARLCYHGPVCPQLPASIHQELRTDCFITENIAADIVPTWDKGY